MKKRSIFFIFAGLVFLMTACGSKTAKNIADQAVEQESEAVDSQEEIAEVHEEAPQDEAEYSPLAEGYSLDEEDKWILDWIVGTYEGGGSHGDIIVVDEDYRYKAYSTIDAYYFDNDPPISEGVMTLDTASHGTYNSATGESKNDIHMILTEDSGKEYAHLDLQAYDMEPSNIQLSSCIEDQNDMEQGMEDVTDMDGDYGYESDYYFRSDGSFEERKAAISEIREQYESGEDEETETGGSRAASNLNAE